MAEKGIIKYKDRSIKYKNINKKKNMIQQVEFSLRPLPRWLRGDEELAGAA